MFQMEAPKILVLSKYCHSWVLCCFIPSLIFTHLTGQNTKRVSGRKVQLENVRAAKNIADVIRTCLGPKAMLKVRCQWINKAGFI